VLALLLILFKPEENTGTSHKKKIAVPHKALLVLLLAHGLAW
jgi:hypothetical protein